MQALRGLHAARHAAACTSKHCGSSPALRSPILAAHTAINRSKSCITAAEDAEAQTEPGVDPRARRLQRQQRRAQRRPSSDAQELQQEIVEHDADADASADSPGPSSSSSSSSARPVSRIAARRQQRSRAVRRVPAATVLDAEDAEDAADADEDEDSSSDDADMAVDDAWQQNEGPDEQQPAPADDEAGLDIAAAAEGDEATEQLPLSVVEALQSHTWPSMNAQRKQLQQQKQQAAQQSTAGSEQQPKQQRQQQRAQQQPPEQRTEPLRLSETNPMYLPVLTDEDLDNDPPGHKSGYVAVIGRPNAGKSTLINAIVGQKLSIVTFKPQTTRHRVVGIASDKDYQMILFDTPGIMQEQRSKLDERMMAAVVSSIRAAEVIIAVVDSADSPQDALAMFQPGADWNGPPMAVLLNKADQLEEQQLQELTEWYKQNCRAEQVFVGSALSGEDDGVAAIKAWAVDKLPEGPTLYPKSMVSDQPERFFVSEIIREQIFLQYSQEIPYACQVQIIDFKEWPNKKDHIQALILVERESQMPILLGAGGRAKRELGTAARKQIEEFLGRPVYLEITVQVAPSWRSKSDRLKDFGYFDPLYIT